MKKSFKIIGIILFALFLLGNIIKYTSKASYQNSIESQIRRANLGCPIPVGGGAGEVTAIKLEENYVTYYLKYRSDAVNIKMFTENPESTKKLFFLSLLCLNGQAGQGDILIDLLENNNLGLRLHVCNSNGNSFLCQMSPDYLRAMSNKINKTPSEALCDGLKLKIQMQNLLLPQRIDEGLYIVAYSLEGHNIITTIEADEEYYDWDVLQANLGVIKDSMLSMINSDDVEISSLMDLCKISHTGVTYRIVGKYTKKVIEVNLSSDDIRSIRKIPDMLDIK